MIIEPLTAEAAAAFVPQAAQMSPAALALLRDPAHVRDLNEAGRAYAVRGDGRVIALAGLSDHGGGRAMAWCYLAERIARFMPGLTRTAAAQMNASGYRRIEMITLADWLPATRWALKLGFAFEGYSPAWFPDGREAWRWGRGAWTR